MKILFSIVLILSFCFSENFKGYILDVESGNPINAVEIVDPTNKKLITNSNNDGYFSFYIVKSEIDSLTFNHIAYKNKTLPISEISKKIYLEKDILYGDVIEITSSRKETRVSDSPILTHVISSKELKSTASLNFYESLQMIIPNLMFTPDYHGTNLKIQGLDSEYILILIDGDRIAGNTVGNIDFSKFNIDEIERIEILKGNASTLYGSNAIGGVINIITKPINKKNNLKINSSYGRFNTLNNSVSFNMNFPFQNKSISSKSNFLLKSSDGYKFEIPDTLRKRKFKDYNISQTLKYKKNDLSIELSGNYYKHDWYRFMTEIPYTQPEQNDRKQYESYSIKLKEKNHLTAINGHYNFSYTFDKYIKYHVIDADYSSTADDLLYDWTNHSVEQISSLLYLFKNKLNTTLGVDLLKETGESFDIIIDDEVILESELGDLESKTDTTIAFFIQGEYAFSNKLNLFLGTRYTMHSEFDDQSTSQITVKYSHANNNFRFNIGQGYRIPNIYELYYDWNHYDGFEIIGNENLKPENSLNTSISYQKLSDDWNLMVLLQRNIINNMIAEERDENGNFYYENYDTTSVNSIETNLGIEMDDFFGLKLNNPINFELTYNFTRIIDEIEYKRLPNISEHMFNINIFQNLKEFNATISGNMSYYGEKIITAPTSGTETFIPGYYQLNVSTIFNEFPLKTTNFKIGINNLLNYTNFDDRTFQSPGTTYLMEISYKYDFK